MTAEMANRTIATKKISFAISTAVPAMPPKPKTAATSAMMRKVIAQPSMVLPRKSIRLLADAASTSGCEAEFPRRGGNVAPGLSEPPRAADVASPRRRISDGPCGCLEGCSFLRHRRRLFRRHRPRVRGRGGRGDLHDQCRFGLRSGLLCGHCTGPGASRECAFAADRGISTSHRACKTTPIAPRGRARSRGPSERSRQACSAAANPDRMPADGASRFAGREACGGTERSRKGRWRPSTSRAPS